MDLSVIDVLVVVASVFGLPWIVAATVHSLNYVKSLSTEVKVADDAAPSSVVTENLVSDLLIHLLIGFYIFLLPLVKAIPIEVLLGLFLFMDYTTFNGTDLFTRVQLWMIDKHLYPTEGYIKEVPIRVISIFTLIQIGALATLWVLKSSSLGIPFTLLVVLLAPLCQWLPKHFEEEDLTALDEH